MIAISDDTLAKFPRVAECNAVKDFIGVLHGTYGESFRDIEALPEFSGIPLRTLHSVYSGRRDVPKKYRARFGLPVMKQVSAHLETYDPAVEHPTKNVERKYKTLWSTPARVLRWQLDNRSEV